MSFFVIIACMSFYLNRYPNNEKPKPILTPRKNIDWEAKAVFNPGVIKYNDKYVMLYRTYPKNFSEAGLRKYRPGKYFKNQISYIGYAESDDGINFNRIDKPFIFPSEDYDKFGCEDPRISKINDTFYITYTAIDKRLESRAEANVRIALAATKDFKKITKHGIIGPSRESKAAAIFEEPVKDGKIGLIFTDQSDSTNSHISIRYFNSIDGLLNTNYEEWDEFIEKNQDSPLGTYWWLNRGPELGAPPMKTDKGWLLIYSAESMSHTWTIGAALLDLDNPNKLIARTPGSILQPVTDYEINGLVPNVTFPSAAQIINDDLYVYYGAADEFICLATCNLNDLLDYMLLFKDKN